MKARGVLMYPVSPPFLDLNQLGSYLRSSPPKDRSLQENFQQEFIADFWRSRPAFLIQTQRLDWS